MGTRSLTRVFDGKTEILCMYRQFDGYPQGGHGQELAEFLHGAKVVNGIPLGEKARMFNGPGCLAASMVAHFKTEPGGFYIHAPGAKDCGEEFEYHILASYESPVIGLKMYSVNGRKRLLFSGSPAEALTFCKSEKAA